MELPAQMPARRGERTITSATLTPVMTVSGTTALPQARSEQPFNKHKTPQFVVKDSLPTMSLINLHLLL